MKVARYLIMGASFLIVVSSAMLLMSGHLTDKTPIYINVGAMVCLTAAVTFMNFSKRK